MICNVNELGPSLSPFSLIKAVITALLLSLSSIMATAAAAGVATFVNHKSKISTMRSKMLAICREIDESLLLVTTSAVDATMSTTARLEDISLAYDFLETQESRVDQVEQELLQATNAILPSSSFQSELHHKKEGGEDDAEDDRMTMSEVAQVLQDLTGLYSKQQERLEQAARSLLNKNKNTTITSSGDNNHMATRAAATTTLTAKTSGNGTASSAAALFNNDLEDVEMIPIAPGFDGVNDDSPPIDGDAAAVATDTTTTPIIAGLPPLYWCIGPTLSAVAETDHETDGTTTVGSTTPASSIFISPAMTMMTQSNSSTGNLKKSASGGSSSSRYGRRRSLSSSSHGTPATPTIPLLSAWTTSVLEQEDEQEDHAQQHQRQHQHSKATTPTNINNIDNNADFRKEPSSGQKRQNDFLRLELQLRRDIHKALHHPHSPQHEYEHDNNSHHHHHHHHHDEYNDGHVMVAAAAQQQYDYAADYDDDDESDDDENDDTGEYDFDESMDTDMYTVATDTSTIVAADRILQCFARPEKESSSTMQHDHDDDEEEEEEEEEEDEDGDDDYSNNDVDDSALYCATVLAEDRPRQPVATTTTTTNAGQQQAKTAQHLRVLAKSSTFPSEIITTKNHHRHRHHHRRSTNHGKNQQNPNQQHQSSLTAAATNLAMEDMTSLFPLVTVLEKGNNNNGDGGGGGNYEMDEAASQVSEAASEETPVLDRYRLDFDEESPNGFRVVPNQRRRHRQHHHHQQQQQQHVNPQQIVVVAKNNRNNVTEQKQVTTAAESNTPRAEDERNDNIHKNHDGRRARFSVSSSPLSAAAAAATTPRSGRRHYNKTSSVAKQKQRMPSTPTIDENSPLLIAVDNNPTTMSSHQQSMPAGMRTPLSNIPDQLERAASISSPSSAGGGGDLTNKSLLQQFNRPLPPSLLYAQTQLATINDDNKDSTPNTTNSADQQHYHSRSLKKPPKFRLDSSPNRNSSSATKMTANNQQSPLPCGNIVNISQAEYDSAPRVVQMQVGYDEVQSVTAALNKSLQRRQHDKNTTTTTIELGEDEIKQLLKPLGLPDRKCRSILMSLCHWRRLVMRRRDEGVFFAISLE